MADDEYLKRDLEYMLDGWRDMQAEILRLRAENEKLRAALKPFADAVKDEHNWTYDVNVDDFRAAAKALGDGDE